ncbi:MtnX-like HAD-IB family phosphatase [Clostridium guangxiense]|uniref:MtnX-like HAD-IB family phosphatase n=1 Tax=Clostridium guangxiense TaxID=1662055 RepID=UPI001E2B7190|nr:MtnX-like HAD-IB family phosphatase [Clostridium guangxiense]MCD2345757.1 MtnX-like HAD-IB family phosphatase [Clostridium guangxiense]
MKKFIFVSDFDGTLTEKDFYKIIMEEYLKEDCKKLYKDWKNKKIKDIDYLGYVFRNIGRNEKQIFEDIMKISLDPFAKELIDNVKANGGEFAVVSAGTSYYIDRVFMSKGIKDVKVYSNKGVFKNNGIYFELDKTNEFYSDIYGIDKGKVVKKLKEEYDFVFYAGDSEPDLSAALISDVVFAKNSLAELLQSENREYFKFENFKEIWDKVKIYLKG